MRCLSSPVRQSQDRFASIRGNAFRQHLYNNIFKGKLEKAFTSQGNGLGINSGTKFKFIFPCYKMIV